MKLHIVSPDIREGDAVGNYCIYLGQALRRCGVETALYAQHQNSPNETVLSLDDLLKNCQADDILLLSFSTFQPRLPALLRLPCRKIVYFHGVTPVDLLLEHDPTSAYWSSKALMQLPMLESCATFIANSRWNLKDLLLHFREKPSEVRLKVLPPVTPDMPLFRHSPKQAAALHTPLELLSVGRIAPHKKIEDLIETVALLNDKGTQVNLTLVGGGTNEAYNRFLAELTRAKGVQDAIHFLGHVSDDQLQRAYTKAEVLLSASQHEGFCIPVLEAMRIGIPVVMRRGTAASEVAQGAALEYDRVEEAVNLIHQLKHSTTMIEEFRLRSQARAAQVLNQADPSLLLPLIHGA